MWHLRLEKSYEDAIIGIVVLHGLNGLSKEEIQELDKATYGSGLHDDFLFSVAVADHSFTEPYIEKRDDGKYYLKNNSNHITEKWLEDIKKKHQQTMHDRSEKEKFLNDGKEPFVLDTFLFTLGVMIYAKKGKRLFFLDVDGSIQEVKEKDPSKLKYFTEYLSKEQGREFSTLKELTDFYEALHSFFSYLHSAVTSQNKKLECTNDLSLERFTALQGEMHKYLPVLKTVKSFPPNWEELLKMSPKEIAVQLNDDE